MIKVFAPAVALAAVALTASACTSSGKTATAAARTSGKASTAASVSGPNVTAVQARQVFDHYVTSMDAALAAGNAPAAQALSGDVQWRELDTALQTAKFQHATPAQPKYGTPSFILPRQTGYPEWFVANVQDTAAVSPALAGHEVPATGRALLVFEKTDAKGSWRLTSSAQLPSGQTLPKLAAVPGGEVQTAPLDDPTTLARPDVVGALQAAVVDDGPANPASQALAGGPFTTGLYHDLSDPAPIYRQPPGDVRQWALEGSRYARFALRTADGGAVVFYAMYLNSTTEVPAELAQSNSVHSGPPIAIPPEFTPLLPAGTKSPHKRMTIQYQLAFAAVDPPASAPDQKVQVLAASGAPSWIST
jgi:hypothetical protein